MGMRHHICGAVLMLGLLLGVHNGYIALWRSGGPEPVRIFPYQASMLPEAERIKLEHGIPVRDKEHLQNLLADYLS